MHTWLALLDHVGMSGKLPIDRVREAQDARQIYDEHRERLSEHRARLEQTDERAEGERRPPGDQIGSDQGAAGDDVHGEEAEP